MPRKANNSVDLLFAEFHAKWGVASEQKTIVLDAEEGTVRAIASQNFLNSLVSLAFALFLVLSIGLSISSSFKLFFCE